MRRTLLFPLLLCAASLLPACSGQRPPPPAPRPVQAPAPVRLDSAAAAQASATRARTRFDEGVLLGRQSRWAEAEAKYREAARLRPDEPSYQMALSTALLEQGKAWEAADALRAGIEAEERLPEPNHRVLAVDYERLVALLTRMGRNEDAQRARERLRYHRQLRDQETRP